MQMRLGKTLPIIRFLKRRASRILVVAPSTVLLVWKEQLEEDGESCKIYDEDTVLRNQLLETPEKWCLLNKESHLYIPKLTTIKWDAIIIDESTFIKNPKAQVTKFFLKHFQSVHYKFLLSGTPAPEGRLDYITQLLFLGEEVGGCDSYWSFIHNYTKAIGPGKFITREGNKRIDKALANRVFFMTRKEAGIVEEKIREVRYVKLSTGMQKVYSRLEQDFILEYDGTKKYLNWLIQQFAYMRSVCNGIVEGRVTDIPKIMELVYLMKTELKDEPVVVWGCFNPQLEASHSMLNKKGIKSAILTGNHSKKKHAVALQDFRSGKAQVLHCQVKLGMMGLPLDRADTAVYYNQPLPYLENEQSEDRIVHTDKKTPLLYIYLLAQDTVEQKVYRNITKKRCCNEAEMVKGIHDEMAG